MQRRELVAYCGRDRRRFFERQPEPPVLRSPVAALSDRSRGEFHQLLRFTTALSAPKFPRGVQTDTHCAHHPREGHQLSGRFSRRHALSLVRTA